MNSRHLEVAAIGLNEGCNEKRPGDVAPGALPYLEYGLFAVLVD